MCFLPYTFDTIDRGDVRQEWCKTPVWCRFHVSLLDWIKIDSFQQFLQLSERLADGCYWWKNIYRDVTTMFNLWWVIVCGGMVWGPDTVGKRSQCFIDGHVVSDLLSDWCVSHDCFYSPVTAPIHWLVQTVPHTIKLRSTTAIFYYFSKMTENHCSLLHVACFMKIFTGDRDDARNADLTYQRWLCASSDHRQIYSHDTPCAYR